MDFDTWLDRSFSHRNAAAGDAIAAARDDLDAALRVYVDLVTTWADMRVQNAEGLFDVLWEAPHWERIERIADRIASERRANADRATV